MYRKYLQSFILLSLSAHNQVFFKLNCYTSTRTRSLVPIGSGHNSCMQRERSGTRSLVPIGSGHNSCMQ